MKNTIKKTILELDNLAIVKDLNKDAQIVYKVINIDTNELYLVTSLMDYAINFAETKLQLEA